MKTVILTRHAKSSWKFPELKDYDRPLKKRGLADAPIMAGVLKDKQVNIDRIISSPAVRAMHTAKIFAQELGIYEALIVSEPKLYMGSRSKLLKEIQQLDDSLNTIVLVAHNPGLTDLANFLLEEEIKNIPTSGIAGIGFEINSWKEVAKGKGKMLFFEYPKMYRKKDEEEAEESNTHEEFHEERS